jgi:hypothetical protein
MLADATCVWRAMAEIKRGIRARGVRVDNDDAIFLAATNRREALDFELRDEGGAPVVHDFIRITDLFDMNAGVVDEMCDTPEEEEADWQIQLSALSGEERDQALAERAALDADIETLMTQLQERAEEQEEEERMLGSSPQQADPRWDTHQYLMQVHFRPQGWVDPGY